jgi:hypothetical protein
LSEAEQTPDAQMRGSFDIGVLPWTMHETPLGAFAMQTPLIAGALDVQTWFAAHSVSFWHVRPHAPESELMSHVAPACIPPMVHAPLKPHPPHVPAELQNGAAGALHGLVAVVPQSPLHATHLC